MYILGISAFYHDAAACLIKNGQIIAAAQEERFTRIKHDASFPANAINFCLDFEKINVDDLDLVVFYDKPFLKFGRLLQTYLEFAPRGFFSFRKSMHAWLGGKLFQKKMLNNWFCQLSKSGKNFSKTIVFSEHHLSHAASAFFPSPYDEAAILTIDGVGEWTTTSLAIGRGNRLEIIKEMHFPHSIGLLYSAITYFCGFKVNSGEYKLMGLAPYGEPTFYELIKKNLYSMASDGSIRLNMKYFDFCTGSKMTSAQFNELIGGLPREPEAELTQREMDLASSIQLIIEEIIISIAKNISDETGIKNLCLAGGVALNCVANGKLLTRNIFENIWIQPAAGDAGGSIGAALAGYYLHLNKPRHIDKDSDGMSGTYLGPEYDLNFIRKEFNRLGVVYVEYDTSRMIDVIAKSLADGFAVGWMNGRMEFGPRSLGARSILADPRSADMQKVLNLKVKFRESFRPFAPSVLLEEAGKWFELNVCSPYMLLVAKVKKEKLREMSNTEEKLFGIDRLNISRSQIPAVTHVDYTARVQTVSGEKNKLFYTLLHKFNELTGCPVLVNTSFNVRGEPIVCTPEDAFRCFMGTDLDMLVVGNLVAIKGMQTAKRELYLQKFEAD